ncbi:putative secreted oxygenase [Rahnella aquatilis CIP 78.65 = ATCC 33071]|jgi:Taurine catabolism dioxygenase TauD, TfdA family.|uniref:Taurine catabolism dioxygenase TauD, TfdA family n=1 Tax=Rahnella aquatilis (strain ATCC 33071 / DSM 4594 / JCM 1683 / NBRC 105701 / NCIMB 13365 / CIP 78.65) TaxID=745277 RepID=H2IRM5_RAHAC|nr:TauD/TfdA family dioxygenase [Rahnella aquatilis]AEX52526.1 Taurine catabolism dioxygenase TauD, TfdA family [Rahnella aquatilis CIP 78.65 = ATCC 33071]KFD06643.1 putative secreted oxygenase [Rahnella aquatilis CIP 78.65 = ATCC 33071]
MDYQNVFQLTDAERKELFLALDKITYDPTGGDAYINAIRSTMTMFLPRRINAALSQQRASIKPRPYLILKNVPVDNEIFFSPCPNQYTPSAKSGNISENLLVGISLLVGEPYSMYFEGKELINNLIPKREAKKEYTGLGFDVELDFHIENAALKHLQQFNVSPMGLLLAGVRSDPQSPLTRISDSRLAIAQLDSEDIATLTSPLYSIKLPYRWRQCTQGGREETELVPLISQNHVLPDISAVFYPGMISASTLRAKAALDRFYNLVKENATCIDICPGDLVYIDNRFSLHSRDKFTPSYDEKETPLRWVQRVFVSANLWNHRNLNQVEERIFSI